MTREPTVISGPIKEPITLAESTLQTKADYTADNPLYTIWIAAARDFIESQAAITIHEKTLEITLDCWPACGYLELPRATPLIAITSITHYDEDGTPTVWSSAEYIADTDSIPGRVWLGSGFSWPSTSLYPANGIRIRYRAGIATTSPETEAPGKIKYPMLLLVNSFDKNRTAEQMQERSVMATVALNFGVTAFIDRLRVESVNY